jgi:hypothetical protein
MAIVNCDFDDIVEMGCFPIRGWIGERLTFLP